MNVKELRDALEGLNDDWQVILQADGEGNGYSPLADVGTGGYVPETTYSGDVYSNDDPDKPEGTEPVVVLEPTN